MMSAKNNEHRTIVEKHLQNSPAVQLIGPCDFDLGLIKTNSPKIYIDGGTRHGFSVGDLALGDGDSSDYEMTIRLSEKKDFSDLAYALSLLPEVNDIELLGFLGGRKDHELMVLAECHRFLASRVKTRLQFEQEITAFAEGSWEFVLNGLFSLFLFEETSISLVGDVEYELPGATLRNLSSHGLSNQAHGRVKLETAGPVFLFLTSEVTEKNSKL